MKLPISFSPSTIWKSFAFCLSFSLASFSATAADIHAGAEYKANSKTVMMQNDCGGEQTIRDIRKSASHPRMIYECNGVRGGAQGTPFVDLIYPDGVGFYTRGDINAPKGRWEAALMQAVWQLSFMQCDEPPPAHPVSLGTKVFDGYWSETGTDNGGREWPVEKDPTWKSNPINPGCSLWIPGEPYLHCSGDFTAKLTFTRSGQVKAKVLNSNLPPTYTNSLEQSLTGLSGHPVASLPPGYDGDSIDLTFKLNVSRKPGPLMMADAKPNR